MAAAPVFFNGKFLSAGPTGVHRVARELLGHLDRILTTDRPVDGRSWSLLHPRDARPSLPLSAIAQRQAGLGTWQYWEQAELPLLARRGVLVSLCNIAPLAHPRNLVMIHDAQVFLSPESYSPAFRAWYRFALPRIGAGAAKVITVSDYSRDRLVEFGVAPRERIAVVHNGVDHLTRVVPDEAILARLGLRPGAFVLAAASAQKHKNLGILFEAFKSPDLKDLTLVVAGPDGAKAFAGIGATPPPGVIFAGRVSDGELRSLYEAAACLAFPSTTEGFGLPPLEAMSLGCPAIVAPLGALPEVCGDAALYAPADDPAAWTGAIRSLADHAARRAAMIQAGLERAARFSWSDSARRLLEVIDRL